MSQLTRRARSALAAAGVMTVVAASGVAGARVAAAAPAPDPAATTAPAPVPAVTPVPAAPAPTASGVPGSTGARTAVPSAGITWKRCGSMQCGTLTVPLDYGNPAKGTIRLSLGRRPADDVKRKAGVIFVNPGGPGGSASSAVPQFAQLLGREVRARYDIIGIDPRGVAGSDLAVCEAVADEPEFPRAAFPLSEAERAVWFAFDAFGRKLCDSARPRILSYMTTADVARDMDRVRAVLGQETINYYGVSYGSYLGATYAALFPERVRTMVTDGVFDPVAWANGRVGDGYITPVSTRIKSHLGTHEALMSAIAECESVGTDECAEAGTIRGDWYELTSRLKQAPVTIGEGPGQFTLRYQDVIATVTGMLYDSEGVPDLLSFLHELNTGVDQSQGGSAARPAGGTFKAGNRPLALYRKLEAREARLRESRIAFNPPSAPAEGMDGQPRSTFDATAPGVLCSDGRSPSGTSAWVNAAASADREAPGFGSQWTYLSSVCSGWKFKGHNAYRGSFESRPAGGMLVMSTLHDPATPYSGARALRRLVASSRLVTVPGWGHATLDQSGCATAVRNNYILTGQLPARDMTCRPDHRLFTPLD